MSSKKLDLENLKLILENLHDPAFLDRHPWTTSLFVQDFLNASPTDKERSPGTRLCGAIEALFSTIKPGLPPRRGKRLDSRWGEFGLLSALYFTPRRNGELSPSSLREAWGRIDKAIQLEMMGEDIQFGPEEIEGYKLVGNESQVAPSSTLSDWHRKGLQRLLDAINLREEHLKRNQNLTRHSWDGMVPDFKGFAPSSRLRRIESKTIILSLVLMVSLAVIWGGVKTWRIYNSAMVLKNDLYELKSLTTSPSLESYESLGGLIKRIRAELDILEEELRPVIWLSPFFKWVPVYGGDLAAAPTLVELVKHLLASMEHSLNALHPLLESVVNSSDLDPARVIIMLNEAQPELEQAWQAWYEAKRLRDKIEPETLSEETRSLIQDDVDRLLPLAEDGLAIAISLPEILGASSDGPKTYLILVQNEDELRPTGGFITAVGKIVLVGGKVAGLEFEDSGAVDNWDRPYPMAPWQLEKYMNSSVLVLRDVNWYTDFPTTAYYAETLYSYHQAHSVDGVIAIDQQMLVKLLEVLGPVNVNGASEPITAENVISFMRASKIAPSGDANSGDWTRKGFIEDIACAVLEKIYVGEVLWREFGVTVIQALDEHHVLMYMDDEVISEVLSRRGWDGALRADEGDFLMVVDANIGFNKTDSLVTRKLTYDVDLTDPDYLIGNLTVNYANNSSSSVECRHWGGRRLEGEDAYPINACYWNYMRIYVPAGTTILDANPQTIPNEWMILGRGQPGTIDVLKEAWDGLQAFGTLMVVPGESTLSLAFSYGLPQQILQEDKADGQYVYKLTIEKQPGTSSIPITIRIHLPRNAAINSMPKDSILQGDHIVIRTDLRVDRYILVNFTMP